jgi:hypothetical protein
MLILVTIFKSLEWCEGEKVGFAMGKTKQSKIFQALIYSTMYEWCA